MCITMWITFFAGTHPPVCRAGVSRRWNIHDELWMGTQKIQYTARPSYSLMRWRSCSVSSVTYV